MNDEAGFQVLEPENAAARDANAPVLALLALAASPQPESVGLPWAVGGFGVPVHPDLVERLKSIAVAAGLEMRFLYGVPVVLTRDGVIVATALGMREIRARLAADEIAPPLLAAGRMDPDLGTGWSRLAAWPVDVPAVETIPALAAVVRVAAEEASSPPARRRRSRHDPRPGSSGGGTAG